MEQSVGRTQLQMQREQSQQTYDKDKEYILALYASKKRMLRKGTLPLCVNNDVIGKNSCVGIKLFFVFLKSITAIYFLMSIISVGIMYINYQGTAIQIEDLGFFQYSVKLAYLSLANVDLVNNDSEVVLWNEKILTKGQIVDYTIGGDLLCVTIIIFYCICFAYYSKKQEAQDKQYNYLPSYFTLQLSGFPETVTSEMEILNDLKNRMKLNVYSVHLARQYNDTLFLHIKSNELRRKYKENLYLDNIGQRKKGCLENCFPTYFNETLLSQKRYLKVIKKNNEIILNTFSQVKYHDDYNSLKAFVVFDTVNDKKKAHQFFQKKYVSNWKLQCCPKRYNKQFMLFEKYSIKSSESVSQPSDILWENIEISSFSRFFRILAIVPLLLLVIFISFLIVIIANLYNQTISYDLCTYEEFMDEKLSNQDCEKAFYEFLVSLVLNTMIGTIIWITNTLMRKIVPKLFNIIRYPNKTRQIIGTTKIIFIATFTNTGLLIFFLHFVIFGFSLPETLSQSGLSIKEDGEMEYFESLNQNFYIQSGSKLIIALVCTAFFFFINFLFGEKLMRKQKLNKAKKLTYKDQMKKILSPKPFDLAYAYSSVLNTIFVTLLYSSGMPVMIPIGAISLLIQYWSFKQSILRYKRKPPEVDTSLHDSVLTILPFSILFHLAFALFVYSEQSILPIPSDDTTKDDIGYLNTYATKFSDILGINSFYDDKYDNVRMLEQNQALTLYIFICIVLTAVFFIIAKYLTTILRILKKIICCGRLQPNAIFNFSNQSYEALFDDMNKKLLPSYDIMDNLEYKGLIQTLNIGVEIDQMENENNENNSQQTFLNN